MRQAGQDNRGLFRIFLLICLAVIAAAVFAGCSGSGSDVRVLPFPPPHQDISVITPQEMNGDKLATWLISWNGGSLGLTTEPVIYSRTAAPFNVLLNFGGGAEPNVVELKGVEGNSVSSAVTMINLNRHSTATYSLTATITDNQGRTFSSMRYFSVGPTDNPPVEPVITTASCDAATGIVTVVVEADSRALPLDLSFGVSSGFTADDYTLTLTEEPLVGQFQLYSSAEAGETTGTGVVTVEDAAGGTDRVSLEISASAR